MKVIICLGKDISANLKQNLHKFFGVCVASLILYAKRVKFDFEAALDKFLA